MQTGTKYEATKDLTTTQVAALVRADIKAAVAAGELPKGAYGVRTRRSSMSSAIDIVFAYQGADLFNAENLAWQAENPHAWIGNAPANVRERYSAEAQRTVAKLNEILFAYNYDGSDIASDYFNVRFYSHVSPKSAWESERREAETLRVRAIEVSREMFEAVEVVSAQESWLDAMGVAS